MKELTVDSFESFHNTIVNTFENGCLLRGVPDATFALLPRVGRLGGPYLRWRPGRDLKSDEINAFDMFCTEGAALLPSYCQSDLDRLVVAQHHGLPTRLLDWTYNPLVALFFAVSVPRPDPTASADGAVYVLSKTRLFPYADEEDMAAPFKWRDKVTIYQPRHVTPRITRQSATFTLYGTPDKALESEHVTRVTIPAAAKPEMNRILRWYGITDYALFPDLDGLAKYARSFAFFSVFDDDA